MSVPEDGKLMEQEVPMRNAMNEVLRDSYIDDCQRGCDRWNKVIEQAGFLSLENSQHGVFTGTSESMPG